jgi:acyl carrier protein
MGLDTIELVLWAEQEFEIEIPDSDAAGILTVGQFATYIHLRQMEVFGGEAASVEEIFDRIKIFMATRFELSPDTIHFESQFIQDLRLDH